MPQNILRNLLALALFCFFLSSDKQSYEKLIRGIFTGIPFQTKKTVMYRVPMTHT